MVSATRTLVLGGGGVTGIAWELGLLAGLAHEGVDLLTGCSVIGTSAGSAVGAQITSGMSLQELYERQLAGVPYEISKGLGGLTMLKFLTALLIPRSEEAASARLGRLALEATVGPVEERRVVIEARLPNHEWPDADLRIVVVDAESGRASALTRADGFGLVDAVAASCAVPLVWPPVRLGGRAYVDGGVRSPLNLDFAVGTGPILAIAPVTAAFRRPGRIEEQHKRIGAERPLVLVTPSAETKKAQGRNSLDSSRVPGAARAGWAQARVELERVRELFV